MFVPWLNIAGWPCCGLWPVIILGDWFVPLPTLARWCWAAAAAAAAEPESYEVWFPLPCRLSCCTPIGGKCMSKLVICQKKGQRKKRRRQTEGRSATIVNPLTKKKTRPARPTRFFSLLFSPLLPKVECAACALVCRRVECPGMLPPRLTILPG